MPLPPAMTSTVIRAKIPMYRLPPPWKSADIGSLFLISATSLFRTSSLSSFNSLKAWTAAMMSTLSREKPPAFSAVARAIWICSLFRAFVAAWSALVILARFSISRCVFSSGVSSFVSTTDSATATGAGGAGAWRGRRRVGGERVRFRSQGGGLFKECCGFVDGVESVRCEPPDGCYQGSAGCKECSERQLSHFSSS